MRTTVYYLLPLSVLFPMAVSVISYCIGRRNKTARNIFAFSSAALELLFLILILTTVIHGVSLSYSIPYVLSGLQFRADGFRALYSCITGLMWFCTTAFSSEYLSHYRNRNRYYFFAFLTLGATVGVFLSSDLLTTFIFFEIMSFTSYVMVIHDENPDAMRAGQTYLAVAVLGGMVMLMGLFLLYRLTGTLTISKLTDFWSTLEPSARPRLYLSGALILFGFGAKAGMYPLHIWLPKAHPVAPAPASALLSGILTKAGVFGVLVLSCKIFQYNRAWGSVLLALAVLTMFTGAFIAVFSVNLKRTLACSSVSQIGFILIGISMQCILGDENALAAWGTVLHMVNHSLFKLVLFMSAGAIYMKCHHLELNSIRGYGRRKPLLMLIFLSGTLGITGFPLFSGYISKTLIHESIVEYIELLAENGQSIFVMKCVEWVFLFSGGLTVAYMTKLFTAIFIEKNNDAVIQNNYDSMKPSMNVLSALALGLPALLFPVFGSFPGITMQQFAVLSQSFMNSTSPTHAVHWFSLTNLKGSFISFGIGLAIYFGFIRTFLIRKDINGKTEYVNIWPDRLDIEESIYRPLCALLAKIAVDISSAFAVFGDKVLPASATFASLLISRTASSLPDWIVSAFRKTLLRPIPIPEENPSEREPGSLTSDIPLSDNLTSILGNFSYGLLLFGIGLAVTLLFLIFSS